MACDPMYPSLLPYSPERDVYRLLQVDPTANSEEIAAACRRLARTFHPDRNHSRRAHEEMQVVNAVRHLLTDPRSRAAYDGARRRYLYEGYRPVPHEYRAPVRHRASVVIEPFSPARQGLGPRVLRFARALGAGLRGIVAEFGPPRCSACRELIEIGDHYCPRCGQWLGRTERIGA
ncbi:MAG TPA: J domain-containing protein [Candidatus Limnocylindria bacterium]|nr:J domain-containing protein [Candidatus Limnocylindria bacterium]